MIVDLAGLHLNLDLKRKFAKKIVLKRQVNDNIKRNASEGDDPVFVIIFLVTGLTENTTLDITIDIKEVGNTCTLKLIYNTTTWRMCVPTTSLKQNNPQTSIFCIVNVVIQ